MIPDHNREESQNPESLDTKAAQTSQAAKTELPMSQVQGANSSQPLQLSCQAMNSQDAQVSIGTEEGWRNFESRKKQLTLAKRGHNPEQILQNPSRYEQQWVTDPKPSSFRFVHFVHQNVKKEEGVKRSVGNKDKKNGFNNRLQQFFMAHCFEQRLSIVKKVVQSFENIGSEIDVERVLVRIKERKKWVVQLNELDQEDLQEEKGEQEGTEQEREITSGQKMLQGLLRLLEILELRYGASIGSTDSDSRADLEGSNYKGIVKLLDSLHNNEEVQKDVRKRVKFQKLKGILKNTQLVDPVQLERVIQFQKEKIVHLQEERRVARLTELEKEIFDQNNYLIKKTPAHSSLPFSIVASSIGEAKPTSAEDRAKIDLITKMCMNVGNVKALRNDPQIDRMLEIEQDPMKAPLFISGANLAKERLPQFLKEEPTHEAVELGFVGQNFNELPQYRTKPGDSLPEMQSYFPQFDFPDGRAKYFSRRNVRERGGPDSQGGFKQGNLSQGRMSVNGTNPPTGSSNTWSHSFIQSSTRDMLMEQLQRSVREEQAGRGREEFMRDERYEQRKDMVKLNKNAIVTVGGVRLDKIVMKTGALSKSSKKTSKMLRGAEMRRGTFSTVGEKLAPLDEVALRKLMTAVFKRETPKMIKFYQKYKTEKEVFLKRAVLACAKEYRKKVLKRGKGLKEVGQRAKKLAKEVQLFWKRQDRELVDAKRKKEKQLRELRRQEEEKRQAELQKKRFQFLLRESTVYADFMARKMGVRTNQMANEQQMDEEGEEDLDSYENLSIQGELEDAEEEARVQRQVSAIIEKQQQHVAAFDNPNLAQSTGIVMAPQIFTGTLKEYQLKGLRWLVNLWEQGINGILADEMGLGKTVQAIALLAHICESRAAQIKQEEEGDQGQGPFLVIAPTTTLHSWLQELLKFCPSLAVMPYWGSQAQRKTFRQYFRTKWLGRVDSSFHVLVTSYQLAVSDQKYLGRIKWKYLVLDEAQAIKNFSSVRWRTLLNYDSRNRLLLTGTPIQNSMAELWALLHFIMPALFQNHDDFQEWFSRDIEAHSRKESALDRAQLDKLHAVLKPFMLRRVKKDVEHELAPKQEKDLLCDMSRRQKTLYRLLRAKLPLSEMFKLADSKIKLENLMNLIMQFRKVCNHPELFERHVGVSPFLFTHPFVSRGRHSHNLATSSNYGQLNFVVRPLLTSPIAITLPRLIVEDLSLPSLISNELPLSPHKPVKFYYTQRLCQRISLFQLTQFNTSSYMDSLAFFCGLSTHQFKFLLKSCCPAERRYYLRQKLQFYHSQTLWSSLSESGVLSNPQQILGYRSIIKERSIKTLFNIFSSDRLALSEEKDLFLLLRMAILKNSRFSYHPRALAAPPFPLSNNSALQARILFYFVNNPFLKRTLFGTSFYPSCSPSLSGSVGKIFPAFSNSSIPFKVPTRNEFQLTSRRGYISPHKTENIRGLMEYLYNTEQEGLQKQLYPLGLPKSWAQFELPDMNRLIQDCGKLKLLDGLLKELKVEGRRTLIFCQMTKMLDILQEFLTWRKYTYLRMDGSSVVSDRRDMVDEFQQNDQIFAFLLSTRAGGLGVTLTAADTVIFYDSDWNPTMDAQATDRVHRIGQTKAVRVYRLMTRGTVEQKILKRAQQKQAVQTTVYAGGALKGEIFRPSEYVGLLVDDEDQLAGQP